jgi:hypothetical protein
MNANAATRPLRVLSFGAGVQSSALARMAVIGEIDPIDHVIFADTGDEPADVYRNVEWWQNRFAAEGIPVHVVSGGRAISAHVREALDGRRSGIPIPAFTKNFDGNAGMIRRQCTSAYKVKPILRLIRQLAGLANTRHTHITDHLVTQLLGISWDEPQRMRTPAYSWMRNEYPLIDKRLTRWDCIAAIAADDQFPNPARSACWHCPYHTDAEWRELRDTDSGAFRNACELDDALRSVANDSDLHKSAYLHRSLKPLSEVDFDNEEDKGQLVIWGDECEGMCGT